MDLYVNFQRLKHNFKKVRRCFCKITRADEFSELMNYFSIEKISGIGPRSVDRFHGDPVHESTDSH
jgi:hypothetical protein